jgi:sialic acid synthase SpsE
MKLKDLLTNTYLQLRIVTRPYLIAEAGVNHEGNMEPPSD